MKNLQTTTTASAQPRTRTKAERKAERLSWAIWAAGVYSRERSKKTHWRNTQIHY